MYLLDFLLFTPELWILKKHRLHRVRRITHICRKKIGRGGCVLSRAIGWQVHAGCDMDMRARHVLSFKLSITSSTTRMG